jgi:hypothetical protein
MYGSDGNFLGRLETVAPGEAPAGKTVTEAKHAASLEWAVLRLDGNRTAESVIRRFDLIPGPELAPVMSQWQRQGRAHLWSQRPRAVTVPEREQPSQDDGMLYASLKMSKLTKHRSVFVQCLATDEAFQARIR